MALPDKVNRVLEQLKGVRGSEGSKKWSAKCPAHEDENPSLSVSQGDGGQVLLKCHAGCKVAAICKAIGLKSRDLFPDNYPLNGRAKGGKLGQIVATYDYTDADGKPLFQGVRFEPKDFRFRRPDPNQPGEWVWDLKGVRRVLYRLPEVLVSDPMYDVYIVEGEKDVDRLASLGLVATCNPMGAGNWDKVDHECIEEALKDRHVVVIPDNDDAGRKHAQQVARSVSRVAASVKVLELPNLPKGGDVSSWLDAGGNAEDLARLVEETPLWHQDQSNHECRGGSGEISRPTTVVRTLSEVECRNVNWLWKGWIPFGAVTILDGDPGLGKSTLTLDIAARVSKGWPMPPEGGVQASEPAGVLLLSAEDSLEHTIRPRLDAAGADVSRVHVLEAVAAGENQRPPSFPSDANLLESEIRKHNIRLVVLDPFMAFLDPELNAHKDQDIRRAMFPFKSVAEATGAAVLVVRHLNKLGGGPAMYRGGGSIGIIGAARSGLIVGKHTQQAGHYVLASTKSNLGPPPRSLVYTHEQEGPVARIGWAGACDLDADDILQSWRKGPTVGEDAARAIREHLAAGPCPMADLESAMKEAGHSATAIREGKRIAGVIPKRAKFSGNYRALLPEHEAQTAEEP